MMLLVKSTNHLASKKQKQKEIKKSTAEIFIGLADRGKYCDYNANSRQIRQFE
jgi:hypothetical protein